MLSQTTREEIDAMVSLLEEPQSSRAFAAYLMKENEL